MWQQTFNLKTFKEPTLVINHSDVPSVTKMFYPTFKRHERDCQVSETYLTSKIWVFFHAFSDYTVINSVQRLLHTWQVRIGIHANSDMYVQISRIRKIRVTLSAAEWFFISILISMYPQISRICKFGSTLCAAEWFFFLVLISMHFQIRRIRKFRFALRVAGWFFILVLLFMYL